jgi:hypothetical protein
MSEHPTSPTSFSGLFEKEKEDVLVLPLDEVMDMLDYLNTKVPSKYAITTLAYLLRKIREQHPTEAVAG